MVKSSGFMLRGWIDEWLSFFLTLLLPRTIISLVFIGAAIFLANNTTDKMISVSLQIIATLGASIAGAWIKEVFVFRPVRQKGVSAVRHLVAARYSMGDLISRVEQGADKEEIKNNIKQLITTITTSVREWIDIVPEVEEGESIIQKEIDLVNLQNEKERIQVALAEADKSKSELSQVYAEEIKEKDGEIENLKREISRVKSQYEAKSEASSIYGSGLSSLSKASSSFSPLARQLAAMKMLNLPDLSGLLSVPRTPKKDSEEK